MALLTGITFLLLLIVCTAFCICRCRYISMFAALPIAFVVVIALQTILLNILSLFHSLTRFWLVTGNLIFLCAGTVWITYRNHKGEKALHQCHGMFRKLSRNRAFQLMLPLWLVIGITAWIYPPNNYDSMTYHMPRVIHWIQNQSIGYFPTPIDRQNVMGPGAEYLLLFFQLITDSDEIANFVQFLSFILLFFSTYYIVRTIRLPLKWRSSVIMITMTAPIAIMEASNTKNDLVAAVVTSAILMSGARFYSGNLLKLNRFDSAIMGICLGVGLLVKPTAILTAFPVILIGVLIQWKKLVHTKPFGRNFIFGIMIFFLSMGVIAGPDLYRKFDYGMSRKEIYPVFSNYHSDRFLNPFRAIAHNIPFQKETDRFLKSLGIKEKTITKTALYLQEDMIGNPYQVMVFLTAALLTLVFSFIAFLRNNLTSKLFLALAPLSAWFIFGIYIRNQLWITRLEIPLFYLTPFSFLFIGAACKESKTMVSVLLPLIAITGISSLAYANLIAVNVPPRPLIPKYFWGGKPDRTLSYYNNIEGLKKDHDFFLSATKMRQCDRIGLIAGGDAPLYPLMWRLIKAGKQVEHMRFSDPRAKDVQFPIDPEALKWPCMLYASSGVVEHVPGRGIQWISAGDYHTFYRNDQWEFKQSENLMLSVNHRQEWDKIDKVNHAHAEFKSDCLILEALNDDPQIFIPVLTPNRFRSGIMVVKMHSPVETVAQLYFKTKKSPEYSENITIKKKIRRGDNIVYFFLPIDDIIGEIRFDPGKSEGIYQIESIEIKGI